MNRFLRRAEQSALAKVEGQLKADGGLDPDESLAVSTAVTLARFVIADPELRELPRERRSSRLPFLLGCSDRRILVTGRGPASRFSDLALVAAVTSSDEHSLTVLIGGDEPWGYELLTRGGDESAPAIAAALNDLRERRLATFGEHERGLLALSHGDALARLGQPEPARDAYARAAANGTAATATRGAYNLGTLLALAGEAGAAEPWFVRAAQGEPTAIAARAATSLGDLRRSAGDTAGAREAYEQALAVGVADESAEARTALEQLPS